MMRPAVFLDRDGVLNATLFNDRGLPIPPRSESELRIPDEVPVACAELRAAGFALICVTNQPDIARGTVERSVVDGINDRVSVACGLDAVFVCPHDDSDGCDCRKPRPGLIFDGATTLNIDMPESFLVGDRYRDIEAGKAAGLRSVLLDFGYPERAPRCPPDFRAKTLMEAAEWILRQSNRVTRVRQGSGGAAWA
jgi:D-glycero-D-manno-heptose 1,7-bisphosphate phosphatase